MAEQEKIAIGSEAGKKINCSMCGKEGTTDQFVTLQSKKGERAYLCTECREKTNAALEAETKNPNLIGAIGLGIIASIIGGILWYFITVAIEREFGYIALGLGYVIGLGVLFGSGKKRGQTLQIIAVVLTLATIFVAEHFIFNHFANEYVQANLAEFPGIEAGDTVSVPWFEPVFLKELASPIGLLIYAIAAYVAYRVPKPRKI